MVIYVFAFLLIVRVKGYHSIHLPESAFDLKYEKFPVFRCIYSLYFFLFLICFCSFLVVYVCRTLYLSRLYLVPRARYDK